MGPVYKVLDSKTVGSIDSVLAAKLGIGNKIIKQIKIRKISTESLATIYEENALKEPIIKKNSRKSDNTAMRIKNKRVKRDFMENITTDGSDSNASMSILTDDFHIITDSSNNLPASSGSSLSSDHDYSQTIDLLPSTLEPLLFKIFDYNTIDNGNIPKLEILDEPSEKFRFRYVSEMNGMHGSIQGRSLSKSKKKSFPSVKLLNYPHNAIILCTLIDENCRTFHPHSLSLRGRAEKANIVDPLHKAVGPENNYTVSYQGLAIVHTAKKKVGSELYKKRCQIFEFLGQRLTKEHEHDLKIQCENIAKNVNLNCVRFLFTAFDMDSKQQICNSVYSQTVFNLKCTETGTLKISRMSKCSGSIKGNEEVFMFVEKVSKKNIQIRFFELDGDNRVWEECASFSENDVHHQYGIVFRTPPYRDQYIQENKKVYVELHRPKDNSQSEPKHFEYKASANNNKRRKLGSTHTSLESSSSLTADYISEPLPVISIVDSNRLPTNICSAVRTVDAEIRFTSLDFVPKSDLLMSSPMASLDMENYSFDDQTNAVIRDVYLSDPRHNIEVDGSSSSKKEMPQVKSEDLRKWDLTLSPKIINEMKSLVTSKPPNAEQHAINIIEYRMSEDNCLQHYFIYNQQEENLDVFLEMVKKYDLDYCLNFGNANGDTGVHVAVLEDMHECIGKLLLAGCDPNILNEDGDSPLHLAVKEDKPDSMVQLLRKSNYTPASKYSLDVNIPNAEGYTALHMAALRGALASVSRLLNANGDPNIKGEDNGRTALHLAVSGGHVVLVDYLLNYRDIQINSESNDGETPLHLACVSNVPNASAICEKLLKAGADPLIVYKNMTALDLAKQSSDPEIYKVFQKKFPTIFKEGFIKKETEDDSNPSSPSQGNSSNLYDSQKLEKNMEEISIKEEPRDFLFMDESTSNLVIQSLETTGLWKNLAENLGYPELVSVQSQIKSANPSSLLLNLIESHERITLKDLQVELERLNLKDAAEAVKAIIKD